MWVECKEVNGLAVWFFADTCPKQEIIGFKANSLEFIENDDDRILKAIEWATSQDGRDFCMANWAEDSIWWDYIINDDDNYEDTLKAILVNKYASPKAKNRATQELGKITQKAAKRHYIQSRRSEFQKNRDRFALALIERDGYMCNECCAIENLTIDHIIPLSKGGSDDLDNLRFLCQKCNSKKGDRDRR